MTEKKPKIEPMDRLKDVFAKHAKAKNAFAKRGMKCAKCKGFAQEQMRHAAQCHGVDINELIEEIGPED